MVARSRWRDRPPEPNNTNALWPSGVFGISGLAGGASRRRFPCGPCSNPGNSGDGRRAVQMARLRAHRNLHRSQPCSAPRPDRSGRSHGRASWPCVRLRKPAPAHSAASLGALCSRTRSAYPARRSRNSLSASPGGYWETRTSTPACSGMTKAFLLPAYTGANALKRRFQQEIGAAKNANRGYM